VYKFAANAERTAVNSETAGAGVNVQVGILHVQGFILSFSLNAPLLC
jgi:hypothetical protein